MFESATLTAAPASTRFWGAFAGVTGQVLIVGCMLLAPLISPAVLPNLRSAISLTAPGPPPPPPPLGDLTVQPRFTHATRVFRCTFCAPVRVPPRVDLTADDLPPSAPAQGVPGGVGNGVPGGIPGGIPTFLTTTAPPPPVRAVEKPPEIARPAPPVRIRAGGVVKLAAPIHRIDPVYPPIARTAHVEGVVELEGIIGTDGRIHDLKVKSGHPFLVKAAVDAVLQWVYTPATLNGDLVEVIAPITVTFRLGSR